MPRKSTGIVERHSRSCPSRNGGQCAKPCQPSYEAWIWSPREQQKIRRSFPTLSAAKGWRSDASSALRRGTLKAPSRRTLDEAAEAWLEGAEAGAILTRSGVAYKPSALRGYRSDLERYVLKDLGRLRLSDLRRSDVQALVDRLVGKGLSGSKVRNAIMGLRAVCRYAIERDEILVNPTANLHLPATGGRRERAASPAEARELLVVLPDSDRPIWAAAIYAGLRRGEPRGLRWRDVDLGASTISVERSWDEVAGPVEPKSAKGTRRVPIIAELRRELVAHRIRSARSDDDDLVFGTADRPFTPTAVRKRALAAWKAENEKRAEQAEQEGRKPELLEPIGLHECRHTFVSLAFAAGLSLEAIGDFVGHGSAYMTDRYRHLLDGAEAEAASRLDTYLERSGAGASGA
ncbi:MAG: site-specific integrase [Gaiellaceae bacterium]|jgi:integrase